VPPGAVAYAALVEHVPAGNEGSPIERNLVRAVVGPMGLDELRAPRRSSTCGPWPCPRQPRRPAGERRVDRGRDGRVMVAAQSPPAECR
jgi:hypothetical protein